MAMQPYGLLSHDLLAIQCENQFGTRTELILYRSHRIRDQIISALVDDLDRVASRLKGKGVSFAKELQTPRPGSHVLHSSFFWLAYGSVPLSFLREGFERQCGLHAACHFPLVTDVTR